MNPICVATFSEIMASFVTEQVNEQPCERLSSRKLNGGTDLVVIKLVEYVTRGTYNIEEFLNRGSVHCKMLGILGICPYAQTVACRARVKFGMEIIYHNARPVPEVERACDARLVPFAEMLRQADFICIVLPLSREAEQLIGGLVFPAGQAKAIFLVWRRLPPIERAVVYLSKHYAELIPLEDIAAVAGLSKFHFVRLFSATLGVTPHRYQLLLRVSHAKALLRAGEKIAEVAGQVGFYDQSHFSRYFRQLAGMTPGRYQMSELCEKG